MLRTHKQKRGLRGKQSQEISGFKAAAGAYRIKECECGEMENVVAAAVSTSGLLPLSSVSIRSPRCRVLLRRGRMKGAGIGACQVLMKDTGFPVEARVATEVVPGAIGDDRVPGFYDLVMLGKIKPRWQRVLLKVSGEALAGDGTQNIDPKLTMAIAREVAVLNRLGVEVAMVVGGGNFFRGANWAGASGLDRASADHIGMMATVMNAIFLQASLESVGVPTRVQTAYKIAEVAEPYIRRRAMRHLEKGRVVIFGAGTGNPFFTTDTAAALRAAEINAEVVFKATNVDGVYDSDPRKNSGAKLLEHVSYREVASRGLNVMDLTAITLCQENSIPVVVFNLKEPENISKALSGDRIGTLVDHADSL